MKKVYNFLGQFLGFLTILLYAFLFANTIFNFNIPSDILSILLTVKFYALFVVCGIAGMEFVAGKKLLVVIYVIILLFVVIFSFFPEISDQITNVITNI